MKPKFRVGDRARVLSGHYQGTNVVITEVVIESQYTVLTEPHTISGFSDTELVRISPKPKKKGKPCR